MFKKTIQLAVYVLSKEEYQHLEMGILNKNFSPDDTTESRWYTGIDWFCPHEDYPEDACVISRAGEVVMVNMGLDDLKKLIESVM